MDAASKGENLLYYHPLVQREDKLNRQGFLGAVFCCRCVFMVYVFSVGFLIFLFLIFSLEAFQQYGVKFSYYFAGKILIIIVWNFDSDETKRFSP